MLLIAEKNYFRQPRPQVKCKDGKWRTSEEMMRDQIFPECALCGDEIRRLRGSTILEHLKGNNPLVATAKQFENGEARFYKYRAYCCQECANIAMEDRDAKAQW